LNRLKNSARNSISLFGHRKSFYHGKVDGRLTWPAQIITVPHYKIRAGRMALQRPFELGMICPFNTTGRMKATG